MSVQIFFSDFFGVDPSVLEEYGTVDISLANDIPLFVDPFLLFNSESEKYQELHDGIIQYVQFLRDKAEAGSIKPGLLKEWYFFPEVKQLWLGFSLSGNEGSGLGLKFARALHKNLHTVFRDFGAEEISDGSHIEKLCLIEEGVGKDNISDFTANLIKHFLLDYTAEFAAQHVHPNLIKKVPVKKARFNYETETWEHGTYSLPFFGGDFVLLAPRDILTKDETWINRNDLVGQFDDVVGTVDNDILRARVNNYFLKRLPPFKVTEKERKEAAVATIREFPELIEYFIRMKEDRGEEAVAVSASLVRFAERRFIQNVREFASLLQANSSFYEVPGGTKAEARVRAEYLKDVIENKGGWKVFFVDGEPVLTEEHLHIMFRLTWMGTPFDVSREVNDGRGPADFKVSFGTFDKTIIEFKLARNNKLKQNLQHQTETYMKASDAQHGLKVILYFSDRELNRVLKILDDIEMRNDPDLILIDGRPDNKPSASNVA